MNGLLLDEYPLIVIPSLAKEIGLNEAIVLQQVHYWLKSSGKKRDGRKWIYNTYDEWLEQFPFWSKNTLIRTVEKLEKSGILITGNYNKAKYDKTKWYSIDYDRLPKMGRGSTQNEYSDYPFWVDRSTQNGYTNTRDYTETTTETNNKPDKSEKQDISKTDAFQNELESVGLKSINLSSLEEIEKLTELTIQKETLPAGIKKSILVQYLDCLRLTRTTGKISANVIMTHLEKMSKYSVDQLHYAMWTHVEKYNDRQEKYTLGILRNTDDHKARQGLMKLMNQGGTRKGEQFRRYPKAVGEIESRTSEEVERLEALARAKGLSGKIRDTHCDF
ncbi:hypothetical protein [Bacillus licheniformis]|uniref:hypothetical protein n=1 Tax=Bacillus licheniformis TaxID=1402 RepID=UPI00077989BB|nr:hypothetical protein [Bacillus licheniformis]KYC82614.1 hypothetical protein B4091_1458 [Bacillus licheniformis]